MFDLASAELLGEYVVREVKDMLGEKLRAADERMKMLEAELADLRSDLHTYQEIALNRSQLPGPTGPAGTPGKDGRDGHDGIGVASAFIDRGGNLVVTMTDGTVGQLGVVKGTDGAPGSAGPTGPQGPSGQSGQIGPPGPTGSDGIGLASAFIDRTNNLVVTMTDGTVGQLGIVKGADGAPGPPGKDGRDGNDGLSIDEMSEDLTDEGVLVHKWMRGGKVVKEARHRLHYMRWCGIWRTENKYELQNVVTWDGSTWLAQCETTAKPGQGSKDWVLITKRGSDGRDGKSIIGPQGAAGKDGRDLTIGPEGIKLR